MNESNRTLTFVGAAVISAVLAFFFAPSNPKPPDDFSDVGKLFYRDFDVASAKTLQVSTFSDSAMEPKTFQVDQKKGRWGILLDPKNEIYYPADGENRLAKTAASVIGIKREQFVTKDPEQYAKFEVIDPLDKDMTKALGRGRRITLKDAEDIPLVDLIIGKRVPKREADGDQVFYYVRSPNEKYVYTARLNVDISTKFADWIESDLLKMQGENLVEILSHKYSLAINQQTGGVKLKGEESNILTREKSSDPWKLVGLKEETEEVNQEEVNTMTRGLDDLKIIGARVKPEQLTADLKKNKKLDLDDSSFRSLASKGFFAMQDGSFLSSEGEVEAITDAGVKYTVRFGEAFLASETELETGLEPEKKAGEEGEAKKEDTNKTKGRYMFITTEFVEQGLGPKPTPPVKPTPMTKKAEEKPETKKAEEPKSEAPKSEAPKKEEPKPEEPKKDAPQKEEPKAEEPKAEPKKEEAKPDEAKPEAEKKDADKPADQTCTQADEAKKEDKPAETKPEATPPAEAKPAETKPADAKATETKPADAKPAAEKATEPQGPTADQLAEATYKQELAKYEQDLKAYEAKIEAGKKKVKELNARFAQWYYVISDENFQKMRLVRTSLVKPKTKPEAAGDKKDTPSLLPGVNLPNGGILPPNLKPEGDAKKPEAKPADEKPAEPKPDSGKPAGEKGDAKPDEKKPEEKKAEEAKKEEAKPEEPKAKEEPKAEEKKTDEAKPEEKSAEPKP